MCLRAQKCLPVAVVLLVSMCWSNGACAQTAPTSTEQLYNALNINGYGTAALDVSLKGTDGQPVRAAAVVTLLKLSNEVYQQETAKAGHVRFGSIDATEYSIQVVAAGYETAVRKVETHNNEVKSLTIELQKLSVEGAAENVAYRALAPKAQREIGKTLELLRSQKVADARGHLDAANRAAPNQAAVQYLYGVYEKQAGNLEQAKSYWTKAVELNPRYLPALLSLADAMLRENQSKEAVPYATRAVETEPTSWRAHAILANVYLREGSADDAEKEAERAMELGHGQAEAVQLVLAVALAKKGEKERALALLQTYLKEHPSDNDAKKLQEDLQRISTAGGPSGAGAQTGEELSISTSAAELPLGSSWLPPDVDERVPPVEQGAICSLEEVLSKAGKQVQEFVKNVERFSATESLKQEAIDKWGISGSPETRKFDYVAEIEEPRHGFLTVEEYRSTGGAPGEFPGGVATNGLPTLALIFHPYYAVDFEMTCEGLTHWNGKPAWQVHFRQRKDKPNVIRSYRLGAKGPSHPVALKGRAWILADSFEIARLETDLVARMPEIKLAADHTAIEYGPVQFRVHHGQMWLPQTAEVYYDWRGKRMHRRHSFGNYLLFAVDEKQKIADPKADK